MIHSTVKTKEQILTIVFADSVPRVTLLALTPRHLEILVAVDEHGSISAAARALDTVQSNVSAHLARLETEVGATLFDRSSGRLTDQGTLVLARARRILGEFADLAADIPDNDAPLSGDVRLACIGTTARWLMPRLLPRVAAAHPAVHVTIFEAGTSSLLPRLVDGDFDAAIVHLPVEEPELEVAPLFAEDLMLLVHEKHEWSSRESITIAELSQHPVLLPPRGSAMRRILERAAATQRCTLTPQAEIDGVRLLTSLAFDGFGPAVVPATAIPNWLKGEFRRVAIPDLPRRAVGWAQRRRPAPSRQVRAVKNMAVDIIARSGPRQPGVHVGNDAFPLARR